MIILKDDSLKMLFLGVASDKAGANQKPYGGTPWKNQ